MTYSGEERRRQPYLPAASALLAEVDAERARLETAFLRLPSILAEPDPVRLVADMAEAVCELTDAGFGMYATLGADGFGFSDTRPAARRFFHIDGPSMAVRALQLLAAEGRVEADVPKQAAERYRLDDVTAGTSGNAGGDA